MIRRGRHSITTLAQLSARLGEIGADLLQEMAPELKTQVKVTFVIDNREGESRVRKRSIFNFRRRKKI